MALIWRSIFEVDQESFVQDASRYVEDWLRWKLKDKTLVLPEDDSLLKHRSGCEIIARKAQEGELSAFRATVYESKRRDQVRTTVVALRDSSSCWGWVDLEQWSADAFVEPWIPIAPGIMTTLLQAVNCHRGPTQLIRDIRTVGGQAGADVAYEILDPARRLPFVVVSPTTKERDGKMKPTKDRAAEVNRRLVGIAPVIVLGRGAGTKFSKTLYEELGSGFDVYGGAIRTYLPGIEPGDSPQVHRVVPFRRIQGRPTGVVADIIAATIQRRACAQPPPDAWRHQLRLLLDPPNRSDDEIEAELLRLEQERDQERELRDRNEETLEAERETAAATERDNDDLRRRVAWYERRMQEQGSPPEPTPVEEHQFDPDFCGDVPPEVARRLSRIAFPKSQWTHADDLDAHTSAAWAKRAWRAFKAMDAYAAAKVDDGFTGNFRDYCNAGGPCAIPDTWVALNESKTTDNNEHFRSLRTLPIDPVAWNEDQIYMPAHIKIEQGGYPAPRIHFYDDTAGRTGKVHVGYFGAHLDSKSKN
jgi:hypothetical protein